MIRFDQTVCTDFAAATRREWLETNGLGGFASGTVAGVNTRRYHGLLVAALNPPVGRTVLLAKLEETLIVDGTRYELSANQYPNTIHPQGYQFLKEFRLDPWPVWIYEVAGCRLEKSVFMVDGENSTIVRYVLLASNGQNVELEARPLLALRDYHATMHENGAVNAHYISVDGLLSFVPYEGLPTLHLAHNATIIEPAGYWYRNFEYAVERARGLDYQEDLFNPCALKFELTKNHSADLIASTETLDIKQVAQYELAELARRRSIVTAIPAEDELTRTLTAAADQFIVNRGNGKTIIAGYHWFSDWGRDTMIALPGLTLTTGRTDVAASILQEFAQHVSQGMLPNRFPDAGEAPEYNTVDATLWYVEAVRAWLAATGDAAFVKQHLYATLIDIIDWHERGTRYGIRVDDDGLLRAGEPGVQLTWMDAKVGDWVVTPRIGKPVEIQALWFNALCVMRGLAETYGDATNAKRFKQLATRAKRSFNEQFWNDAAGCFYDVVNGDERDGSIRPNQIFAVSLPHTMLAKARAKRVVAVVERDLLTPYGLRSLASADAQYCAHYNGGVIERDGAYHQGTVWAWLLGPFVTAYLKVNDSKAAYRKVVKWKAALATHLLEAGLGQVSEVFDGAAPHEPGGCVAQAWSVAEWLHIAKLHE
ncbi:MAG: glycogen debranching protein [Acidobacteria bacterium]|nr:glycogen debranching protein [Acidobacteriota bacterium]